jgi:hypothetical protein
VQCGAAEPCRKAESSGKDYEAIISRALLIKPLASTLASYPDIYEVGVTCVEVRPSFYVPDSLLPLPLPLLLPIMLLPLRLLLLSNSLEVMTPTMCKTAAGMARLLVPGCLCTCIQASVASSQQVKADYSDLEAVVKGLLGDPDRMQRIADTAFQRLLSHASERPVAQDVAEVLMDIVERDNPSSIVYLD